MLESYEIKNYGGVMYNKKTVEDMVGMTVTAVNVHIQGINYKKKNA